MRPREPERPSLSQMMSSYGSSNVKTTHLQRLRPCQELLEAEKRAKEEMRQRHAEARNPGALQRMTATCFELRLKVTSSDPGVSSATGAAHQMLHTMSAGHARRTLQSILNLQDF